VKLGITSGVRWLLGVLLFFGLILWNRAGTALYIAEHPWYIVLQKFLARPNPWKDDEEQGFGDAGDVAMIL
jgi:hypothetical protein